MIETLGARIRARIPEIAAVLLAAAIGTTVWLASAYDDEARLVRRSLTVERNLSRLLSTVQDAETGNRGYLITGDESYLQPYHQAATKISGAFDAVANLVADNPGQQRTLGQLRPAVEQRFALLNEGIELRRAGGIDAAIRFIQTDRGRYAMDQVRAAIARMEATEADLLRTRRAATQGWFRAASVAAVLGFIVVILAIAGWIWTARRDARELLATTAEREQAEAQIRQMQKIEALGQLTGGVAHDFNNMLAVIISGLDLVRKRLAAGDTDVLTFVEAAMDGATRAVTLTSRLMAFSRQQPLTPRPVDASRLVGGMSDLVQRALGETIRTEIVLGAGVWRTHADAGQLESAILNLCVNARDAMPEGGKLTIETANGHLDDRYARQHGIPAGQYVLIAVTDTGTGMPPEVVARAFDPFFTTKEVGRGTGLGLSQVHGFVKQSGGHIKIYSESGHGTTVKIYLPRFYEAGAEPAPGAATEEPGPRASEGEGARHTILVVEDDERVRESSVSLLRELGYDVIHANGAGAALRQLDAHPDTTLLFTDIVMAGMNGRQLADEAMRRRPGLKVLFTTGFTRNAIVHRGVLDAGVQFIPKPFTLEQLAVKIQEVLVQTRVGETGGTTAHPIS